mgnify:CR=1 FL=1
MCKVVYVTGGVRWRRMRERNRHILMCVDQSHSATEHGWYSIFDIYVSSNMRLYNG